jgi:hypothetical protein
MASVNMSLMVISFIADYALRPNTLERYGRPIHGVEIAHRKGGTVKGDKQVNQDYEHDRE